MEQFLEITKVKDSGKKDNYGNSKCYVSFLGKTDEVVYDDVYAAFKDVPAIGTIRYGAIQDGEYGPRFKSAQIPEGVDRPAGAARPVSSPKAPQGRSDNSDGMRQGMSINNAAKYVIESAVKDSISLDPEELAAEIKRYAKAIYGIDLSVTTSADDVMKIMSE